MTCLCICGGNRAMEELSGQKGKEKGGEALTEGVLIVGENKYTTFSNKGAGLQRDSG